MTKIAWLVGGLGSALAWLCASACVGVDPTLAPADAGAGLLPGELGGPCNKGTCLTDLVCEPKLYVCVRADGGAAPTDGSTGDAADVDGGADAALPTCPPIFDGGMTQVSCDNTSGGGSSSSSGSSGSSPATGACTTPNVCCLGSTMNSCEASAANCAQSGGKLVACGGDKTCGSTEVCCLNLQPGHALDAGACPTPITASEVKSTTCVATACGTSQLRVCRSASECAGMECRRLKVDTTYGPTEIGVCL